MSKQYTDDKSIADADELWRRIFPGWVVPDQNVGGLRISSQAFEDSKDGTPCSIFIAQTVVDGGRSAHDLLAGFDGYSMAALSAGVARDNRQAVCRDERPEEPAHGAIVGKKTKPVKNALAKYATEHWFIPPS